MKNLLKSIMAGVMSLSVMGAAAFAEVPEKVEIKFAVGDETLTINGEAVTVEKPYVVGDGVTLVPLRVITEAFGAAVVWDGETKSITLDYPDVKILLQIGNSVAEVNSMAETLLASPELTPNGVTMVPLRFISETFGADVGYDNETKAITVIKEAKAAQSTVVGAADEARIGDGYYGWSIENATEFTVADRDFDGSYTEFVRNEKNDFTVYVSEKAEDYDFDRDFIEYKDSFSDYTLVKADKDTSDVHNKKMYLQAKDKVDFINVIVWVTDRYIYELYGYLDNGDAAIKEECIRVMSTFTASFNKADTYDMSGIENGMRKYTNEDLKFSFDVPQSMQMISGKDSANSFRFLSGAENDSVSTVILEIYSKSDVTGAEALAQRDMEHNKKSINPDLLKEITDVKDCDYDGKKGYEYSYEIKGTKNSDFIKRDVFFELGSYVYNMGVTIKTPDDNALPMIDNVIRSLDIKELDANEVGILMRNDPETEGTYLSKSEGWSIEVPNSFSEITTPTATGGAYIDNISGTFMTISITQAGNTSLSELREVLQAMENNTVHDKNQNVVQRTKDITLGTMRFSTNVISTYANDVMAYAQSYVAVSGGKAIAITIGTPELTYTDELYMKLEKMVGTLKVGTK